MKILSKLMWLAFNKKRGFTLLEVLLVVALLAILAGIVILALNPTKQLGDTRNSQRRVDVNTILNAVYQYAVDTGSIPSTITTFAQEICKTGGSCAADHLADLSTLTTAEKYLVSIPRDPLATTTDGVGYRILKSANNRVTITAPIAEQGVTISVTR